MYSYNTFQFRLCTLQALNTHMWLWFYWTAAVAAAKSLQSCPTLCDPRDGSPSGSPVPGILQARNWSGLPFPSPVHESEKWKWSHSVVPNSLRPHGLQPTGVGCHCLLWHLYMATEKTIALTYRPLSAKWCLCFLVGCLGLSQLSFQGASGFSFHACSHCVVILEPKKI